MTGLAEWTPRDGETVHFRSAGGRSLPTGRYRLEKQPGDFNGSFWLQSVTGLGKGAMTIGELQHMERAGQLTPISQAELDRDRQVLQLRSLAPLRGNRRGAMVAQHDASDLALFRSANEPGFGF